MTLFTTDNKSAQVGFGYDSVGRLSSLTRTANEDFATTINTSYTLDLLDRVTSITHSKVTGEDASTLSQFTYGYDVGGRVTNYTGPEGSLSYALDANGQLLSVTGSRTDNYSFDATGNRTSNSTAAGNLLLNDGKYSYTYDLEGNQKTKTRISDGQMTEFFWDYRNQLTKALVKDANGVLLKELRFTYDVEGRRVGSWVDADGAGLRYAYIDFAILDIFTAFEIICDLLRDEKSPSASGYCFLTPKRLKNGWELRRTVLPHLELNRHPDGKRVTMWARKGPGLFFGRVPNSSLI
jgi:hypothetical protein